MQFIWLSICILVFGTSLSAQAQEWRHYGGDAGGSKFSSLTQINTNNVGALELAWTYRYGDLEKYPERKDFAGYHVTPILLPEEAGGSLAICTPFNRMIALDPANGTERWSYDPKVTFAAYPTRLKCLGVTYWRDETADPGAVCKHRLFMGTSDRRLISVDAKDGKPCADFGRMGQVDVGAWIAKSTPPPPDPWGVVFSAPPVVSGDTVVIGSINNMKNQYASAPSGAVRAFDTRTGAFKWEFDPIPRNPNDPEAKNWDPEALAKTGGGNPWTLLSVDEERDLIFIPTSSASPNFFGGTRPGDNRYANSVVALRGATGEVVWHFQTIHHDVWDWDMPAQPMLIDLNIDGEQIPIVAQLSKQGFIYTFHRETGEPYFDIEERPVPTNGVPGEQLSPTQPFPVKPPALVEAGITPDDAWGLTFYDRGKCREQIESANWGPIYTPPSTQGWIQFPSTAGAMNWGGGSFDPRSNTLVTNTSRVGIYLRLLPKEAIGKEDSFDPSVGAPMGPPAIIKGTDYAIEQRLFFSPFMIPCTAPPWSELVAVDLAKGEIKWKRPFGMIDKLSPIPLPLEWGTPTAGGPISTAGGLTFIGATADSRLRAFETESGKELWQVETPRSSHAVPMTYEAEGRQFVVIASGGHIFVTPKDIDDHLMAYALPVSN